MIGMKLRVSRSLNLLSLFPVFFSSSALLYLTKGERRRLTTLCVYLYTCMMRVSRCWSIWRSRVSRDGRKESLRVYTSTRSLFLFRNDGREILRVDRTPESAQTLYEGLLLLPASAFVSRGELSDTFKWKYNKGFLVILEIEFPSVSGRSRTDFIIFQEKGDFVI